MICRTIEKYRGKRKTVLEKFVQKLSQIILIYGYFNNNIIKNCLIYNKKNEQKLVLKR